MANIHSQKKRILRTERERLENRRYTSAIKTHFRRLETTMASGDTATADAEHHELVTRSTRPSSVAPIHRNTGAHRKSRAARVRTGASS